MTSNTSHVSDSETTSDQSSPTAAQKKWLERGLQQAGGKLPLFDESGRRISRRIVQTCLDKGWAEPWFFNKLKPDWLVCRLTETGRQIASK